MSWLRKSKPVSGSSRTSTDGSATRARAISTIWNCPPDMARQGIRAKAAAPMSSRARSAICSSARPGWARTRMCGARPTITISAPLSPMAEALRACGTYESARPSARGVMSAMSRPSINEQPRSHFCRPIIVRSNVVFPAPLGPRTAMRERAGTVKPTSSRMGAGAPG